MSKRVYILTLSVGTILWVLDAWFGWLSMLLGGFPGLILISIIVGLLAANWKDGVISILIVNIIGVVIAGVLALYIFPDWGPVVVYHPITSIIMMIFYPFANGYSVTVYHEFYYLLIDNPELIRDDLYLGGLLVMGPIYYVSSLILAVIGGFVGNRLKPYFEGRFSSSSSGVAEKVPSPPSNHPDSQDGANQ